MSAEDRAAMLVSAHVHGEIQNPADFLKLHSLVALIKMRKQQLDAAKAEYKALEERFEEWKAAASPHLLKLVKEHGQATKSGGYTVRSAHGYTYSKVQKERQWRITDMAEAVAWIMTRANLQPADLLEHDNFRVTIELSSKGRERLYEIANELLTTTGEIPEGVDYTDAGRESIVTVTKNPTQSTAEIAQAFMPRARLSEPSEPSEASEQSDEQEPTADE